MISMVVMKTRRRAICIPTFGSQSLNIYRFDYKKIRDASVGTQMSGRKSRDANVGTQKSGRKSRDAKDGTQMAHRPLVQGVAGKKFSGEGLKLYGFKTTFPWGDTAHRRRE